MRYTENYRLPQIELEDNYDIEHFNDGWRKTDEELKRLDVEVQKRVNYDDTEIRDIISETNASLDNMVKKNDLGYINVLDYGLKGDGTDETLKLNSLLDSIRNKPCNIFFPRGIYKFSKIDLYNINNIKIYGENGAILSQLSSSNSEFIDLRKNRYLVLSDLIITKDGDNRNGVGIALGEEDVIDNFVYDCSFYNIEIRGFDVGIKCNNCWINNFYNVYTIYCNLGSYLKGGNLNFFGYNSEANKNGIVIDGGSINLQGLCCEGNTDSYVNITRGKVYMAMPYFERISSSTDSIPYVSIGTSDNYVDSVVIVGGSYGYSNGIIVDKIKYFKFIAPSSNIPVKITDNCIRHDVDILPTLDGNYTSYSNRYDLCSKYKPYLKDKNKIFESDFKNLSIEHFPSCTNFNLSRNGMCFRSTNYLNESAGSATIEDSALKITHGRKNEQNVTNTIYFWIDITKLDKFKNYNLSMDIELSENVDYQYFTVGCVVGGSERTLFSEGQSFNKNLIHLPNKNRSNISLPLYVDEILEKALESGILESNITHIYVSLYFRSLSTESLSDYYAPTSKYYNISLYEGEYIPYNSEMLSLKKKEMEIEELVLKSQNGIKFRLEIDDDGVISAVQI